MENSLISTTAKHLITIEFAEKCVNEVWAYLLKKYNNGLHRDLNKKININPKRHTSRGGTNAANKSCISLQLAGYAKGILLGNVLYKEYRSIESDPVIGSCYMKGYEAILALVCHELAHTVQFSFTESARKIHSYYHATNTAHGQLWQEIYRDVRWQFINNKIFDFDAVYLRCYTKHKDTPEAAKAATIEKQYKNKENRKFTKTERVTSRGWLVHEYFVQEKSVVKVATKKGYRFQIFDEAEKCWKNTRFTSLMEVRKAYGM